MRYCLVIFLLLSVLKDTYAQDTVIVLPESTIRPKLSHNQQTQHQFSLRSSNISNLLFTEFAVNIRSNAALGLSTLNYRGFGPEQTRITWNGMPLNNPMNGQIDLALIPVFFIDNASLADNASETKYSSPVGGELALSSSVPVNRDSVAWQLSPYLGVGSFASAMAGLDFAHYSRKFSLRTRTFYSTVQNNYKYFPYGLQHLDPKRLEHAQVESMGLIQDLYFGQNQVSVWMQDVQRNIPPTLLESVSAKHQSDQHLRVTFNRSDTNALGRLNTSLGFSKEELLYTDKVAKIISENSSTSGFASVQQEISLSDDLGYTAGLDGQLFGVKTSAYGTVDPLMIVTLRQLLTLNKTKWQMTAGGKMTGRSLNKVYVTPSVDLKFRWSSVISTSFSYDRGIRFPTLNNLYWIPGGDINIGVESSDNVTVKTTLLNKNIKFSAAFFGARIYDRIQWLPDESGLFTVSQQKGVTSANYGTNVQVRGLINRFNFEWSLNYNYIRSLRDVNNPSLQNIFIPIHQGGGSIGLKISDIYVGITQSIVSERFTTTTNDEWMDLYMLTDILASVNMNKWKASIRIANLLDEYYEMLPFRPMPMRSFQINFQYHIINKN